MGRRAHLERGRGEKVEQGIEVMRDHPKGRDWGQEKKEEELRGRKKMGGDAVFPSGDEI